jgi:hypothetical protein
MKTRISYVEMSAEFSEGRTLRYWLERAWSLTNKRRLVVIGLNPSTADDTVDDPTIRRCVGFAKREVCGGLIMVNLFGYRATSPVDLLAATDPGCGKMADSYLLMACAAPDRVVVAAWGAHGGYRARGALVLGMLRRNRVNVFHFGLTKDGHPKHPLYLPATTPLTRWE